MRCRWIGGLAVIIALAGCGSSEACPQAPGLIADGIARFAPSDVDCTSLPASMALTEPRTTRRRVPDSWPTTPVFSAADGHQVSIEIAQGTSLYGTGEIAGPLLRNGAVTEVWTRQPFRVEPGGGSTIEYDDQSKNLYQAHPWVLAVRPDGSAFGVLADTTYRLEIDLSAGIRFSAAVPFPVIVIDGDSPQHVLMRLAELTGTMELPPLWAIGYQQARYSYTPDARVREIADEFRARSLPCDVIWLDIDYMDEFRIFTFDPVDFPDPDATNDYLHDLGFKSVWILDPGVKEEADYFVFEEGAAGGHFLRYPDGMPFRGRSWPGVSRWPDFTRPETREWWGGYFFDFLSRGIDGVWIDLNEPALIFPLGAEFPEELVHEGGEELPSDSHARYHNVYGFLMARATYDAMRASRPDRRPFLLSRSNYIGGQRYAAAWTGDNSSTWDHLYWSVTMILNLGLSGQPFSGPDIGGFQGGEPGPSPALFAHWMGAGAFFPFSRAHASNFSPAQEPWVFGEEVETISRTSLERRYRLLPFLYTLFWEASQTGLPVMRPIFFADPSDPALRAEDHAFLLGADILVEPVLTEDDDHVFERPAGIWWPLTLVGEAPELTPSLPPLFIRGGAIVPVGRVVQSTTEALLEPLTLLVSLDETQSARGRLYEDAGEGYGYLDGDYLLTTYIAEQRGNAVELRVESREGDRAPTERVIEVKVITDSGVFSATGSEAGTISVPLDN